MAQFVAENTDDLVITVLCLLQQGVVYAYVLLHEAEDEGVGVRGSTTAINDVQFVERECEFVRELNEFFAEVTLWQWVKLVEERGDEIWIDDEHDDRYGRNGTPQSSSNGERAVMDKVLQDVVEEGQDRGAQNAGEHQTLEQIGDKRVDSGAVETVFGLKNECFVNGGGQVKEGGEQGGEECEDESLSEL